MVCFEVSSIRLVSGCGLNVTSNIRRLRLVLLDDALGEHSCDAFREASEAESAKDVIAAVQETPVRLSHEVVLLTHHDRHRSLHQAAAAVVKLSTVGAGVGVAVVGVPQDGVDEVVEGLAVVVDNAQLVDRDLIFVLVGGIWNSIGLELRHTDRHTGCRPSQNVEIGIGTNMLYGLTIKHFHLLFCKEKNLSNLFLMWNCNYTPHSSTATRGPFMKLSD